MYSIEVTVFMKNRIPGTTMWVNILLAISRINAIKLFKIGYNFHVALQDNHIIAISCMDNNPRLLSKIF